MTHDLYLERWKVCYPGNNASCLVIRFGFATDFVLFLAFVFGTLVTVLGNFVVILSVCHFKHLHKPTNVLILSLALVDLLVGVIIMPLSAVRTVDGCWYFGDIFCHLHISFEVFLLVVSIFHLSCIAVDRYQAICNPLHYARTFTLPFAVIMVCVSWTLAAVYSYGVLYSKANAAGLEDLMGSIKCLGACLSNFNPIWGILNSVFCFFFPCTLMVCLYTQIFIVAKRHVRKMGDKNNCSNNRGRGGLIKRYEHKAAKTLGIVLGTFIFCWMPVFMQSIINLFTSYRMLFLLLEILVWLAYFNSALNPIIYALFYPSFKKCFHCIITLKIFSPNSSSMDLTVK